MRVKASLMTAQELSCLKQTLGGGEQCFCDWLDLSGLLLRKPPAVDCRYFHIERMYLTVFEEFPDAELVENAFKLILAKCRSS